MDGKNPEEAVHAEANGKPVEALQDEVHVPPSSDTLKQEAEAGKTQSTTFSITLQTLTDKALHFLSHASNETLGACLVGLGATTYFILGRVGLVVIGIAGGVVLHATWEGVRSDNRDEETVKAERDRRQEAGVEVVKRILEWRASKHEDEKEEDGDVKVYATQDLDYSAFQPETAKALNTFTEAIINDYVYYWYRPTLPGEETFPASCRRTFTAFMLSLSGHLRRKRPADMFLDFVTNSSSIIIVFLNELSAALSASPNSAPSDAISTYLELKPDSSLAYLLNENSQNTKLAYAAEDILQAYLDPKAYNFSPSHLLLKEVLAQLVLGATVTLCSRPEWINDWIVYGLEESKTTKQVMDIVDAGVEGHASDRFPGPIEPQPEMPPSTSKREGDAGPARSVGQQRRQMSKGEEAMDDAMREAKRLTELMVEEDERRAREEQESQVRMSGSEDYSNASTQGAPTPTSSQSGHDRLEEETTSWTSQTPSVVESPANGDEQSTTPNASTQPFTSFDQLDPSSQPTALLPQTSPEKSRVFSSQRPSLNPQLTLHNANISIFDDSVPGERTSIKAKPTTDYLIQIEPTSSTSPGWMIARKYADFETLHEVLRRLSVITGAREFSKSHPELPMWRAHTKASLRSEMERYLTDAVHFQPLAESENMKRFLEKDLGMNRSPSGGKSSFGWAAPDAFNKLGGDMINVLTKAPKQVAGGGKAVFGGVAGLVGNVGGIAGNKRPSQVDLSRTGTGSTVDGAGVYRSHSNLAAENRPSPIEKARQSQDSLSSPTRPASDPRLSTASGASADLHSRPTASTPRSSFEAVKTEAESLVGSPSTVSSQPPISPGTREVAIVEGINLPLPPSEMPEDFRLPAEPTRTSAETFQSRTTDQQLAESVDSIQPPPLPPRSHASEHKPEIQPKENLSERETYVAVELMFAVITELYNLSSAWNIRRTILAAAKTFLLRPGNPQLLTIRDLLQSSLLDANLSDSGLAFHIYKLRENGLPTVEELEIWARDYPEKNEQEKDELRAKARKLLVTKGMPSALQSVMGAAASGEALGKVFDCLQDPRVSRGLVFGLLMQALRIVTD